MEDIRKVAMAEVERLMQSLPQWRMEKVLAMKNDDVRRDNLLAFCFLSIYHSLSKFYHGIEKAYDLGILNAKELFIVIVFLCLND